MGLDPNQAVAMRDGMLMKLNMEHEGTKKVIDHLPDDNKLSYTPHEKVRNFAALSTHIYDTGMWFAAIMDKGSASFEGEAPKPEIPTTKKELLDLANTRTEQFISTVKSLTPEQLTKEIEFFTFGSFPAVTFFDWHLSHMIHHRGQLTTYLRTMDAKVPALYGDSADYPM